MGRRAKGTTRVLGPYWHKGKDVWYAKTVRVVEGDEERRRPIYRWFGDDETEAQKWVDDAREKLVRLDGTTVDRALTSYRTWLIETGHKKPSTPKSADETIRRLKLFFESVMHRKLAAVTDEDGERLYRTFAARTYFVGPKNKRREKPYSVAHHRHTLAQAKSFLRWAVKPAKLIASNPLDEVRGFGSANVGKEQLTGDESRTFYKWCVFKAVRGDEAALGLLMCLLMALRQGDVRKRVVRDVDLEGTVLRIGVGSSARSKTKKGDVPREITKPLQPLVQQLVVGRSPLEPLFKTPKGGFHTESWLRAAAHRFCTAAGVPYVCPHGLKGTAGTLAATKIGALANQVAEYLSHEQESTSDRHYVAEGGGVAATTKQAFQIIAGGKAS